MQIDIENSEQMLSHLLMNSASIVKAVADTPEWKDDFESRSITCTVQMNGIEVPAEYLEELLKEHWRQAILQARETYDADNKDKLAELRAKRMVEDYMSNLSEFDYYVKALCEKFSE